MTSASMAESSSRLIALLRLSTFFAIRSVYVVNTAYLIELIGIRPSLSFFSSSKRLDRILRMDSFYYAIYLRTSATFACELRSQSSNLFAIFSFCAELMTGVSSPLSLSTTFVSCKFLKSIFAVSCRFSRDVATSLAYFVKFANILDRYSSLK